MVGRQSPLSVCLFSVFATMLAAMCERIHTDSLSSIPGKSRKTLCALLREVFFVVGCMLMIVGKESDRAT